MSGNLPGLPGSLADDDPDEYNRRRIETMRAAKRPWREPKGRTSRDVTRRAFDKARSFIKQVSPEMAEILYDLARHAEDERVRSVCAIAMLDRAGHRPRDYDPNEDREEAPAFNPRSYSADELDLIERALALVLERRRGSARANGSPYGAAVIDGQVLPEEGGGVGS